MVLQNGRIDFASCADALGLLKELLASLRKGRQRLLQAIDTVFNGNKLQCASETMPSESAKASHILEDISGAMGGLDERLVVAEGQILGFRDNCISGVAETLWTLD